METLEKVIAQLEYEEGPMTLISIEIGWDPDKYTQEQAIIKVEEEMGVGSPFELIDDMGTEPRVFGNLKLKDEYIQTLSEEEFLEVDLGGVTVDVEI